MIKNTSLEELEFQKYNEQLLLHRLKIVSIALFGFYGFYLFVDIILLNNFGNEQFRLNLALIHLFSCLISFIYLLFYPRLKRSYKNCIRHSKIYIILIKCYIICYLFLGMLATVNSQALTGNIDAYIITLIGVATIFPIRPKSFFYILFGNLIAFILLLVTFSGDSPFLITKLINITGVTAIAFIISLTFYTYRRNDFANQIKLRKQEEHFRNLFEVNPYPLILASLDDKILLVNKAAKDYFAINSEQEPVILDMKNLYRSADDKQQIFEQLQTDGSVRNYIIEHATASGQSKWSLVNYELFEYDDELCVLAGITDITKLKEAEKELLSRATIDVLTGVMNRRSGMETLREALKQTKETKQPLIICFVDINHLKQVNDEYGHIEGDRLIKTVSNVLMQSLQPTDILFRYGGDEFIVAFPGRDSENVDALWETILQSIDEINQTGDFPYEISVSCGCYHYTNDADYSLEQLVRLADMEMYKEKSQLKKHTL